jgi:hypothetical protein
MHAFINPSTKNSQHESTEIFQLLCFDLYYRRDRRTVRRRDDILMHGVIQQRSSHKSERKLNYFCDLKF